MAHRNDVALSTRVIVGSSTGIRFSNQNVFTASGYRKSNQRWDEPLRLLTLQYRRPITDAAEIRKTFLALSGSFDTFLARDWTDWHTALDDDMEEGGSAGVTAFDAPLINPNTNQNNGDGSTQVFQCHKSYTSGSTTNTFRIRHPVASTVKIGDTGVDVTDVGSPTITVNEITGEVTFPSPPAAGSPSALTWGGEILRAVAFVQDDLEEILRNLKVDSFGFQLQEIKGA